MKSVDRNELDLFEDDPSRVNAPEEVFQGRLRLRGFLVPLLAILSCVLLTVSFIGWYFHLPYLAYFALVPWGLAMGGAVNGRWAILWAWLGGVVFWAINLYWLWWITLPGYVAGIFYLSAYWLIAAVILRGASRRSWPMWICLPIVWTALEFIRGSIPVLGFPWFFLAHSQYCRPWLIQISDITGQYGVSFLVAMANGVAIDLLALPLFGRIDRRNARILRRGPFGVVVFAVLLGGMLAYGWYRTEKQTGYASKGPPMAIVQQAYAQSIHRAPTPQEKVLVEHIEASRKFIGSGCYLLLWSESTTPRGLNPEWMQRLTIGDRYESQEAFEKRTAGQRVYKQAIARLLGELKCPLLTGAQGIAVDPVRGDVIRRNAALMFDQSGQVLDQYAKRRLVPFSEYVPFKDGWPWLHRLLRGAVPPQMPQLEPGDRWTRFKLVRGSESWTLASPICFEGTFPSVCRSMVVQDGRKVVDILVNLSNDGWFVWKYADRPYRSSSEHPQHLVQYCFRAVETRSPVVRCANTGISASIDSNGRIIATINLHGNTMVPGVMLLGGGEPQTGADAKTPPYQIGPGVLVDNRVTLYSIVGDAFAWILVALTAALVGAGLWARKVEKKG